MNIISFSEINTHGTIVPQKDLHLSFSQTTIFHQVLMFNDQIFESLIRIHI